MTSTQSIRLCGYRYDPLDRLINQTLSNKPAHQRFYRKSRLATEIQGMLQYSFFQHSDHILAQIKRQRNESDVTLLATDMQRSVLQTFKANHQRQSLAYSPYGHRPVDSELSSTIGFSGERQDHVTGHYLLGNGYRAFNPVLMRFNSPDNWSPFGKGGLNSYVYCEGNPIIYTDPTGHNKFSALTMANLSTWATRAKSNLNLSINQMNRHTSRIRPSAIKKLNVYASNNHKELGLPAELQSSSYRFEDNPGYTFHNYKSGINRTQIMHPTRLEKQFNATTGLELDSIIRQPYHPRYEAVKSLQEGNSIVNISNHLSIPNPRLLTDNAPALNTALLFEKIDSGLTGNIPGLMPSMLIKYIRNGTGELSALAPQLRQKYPQLFNQNRRG
ncbi:RHS repeat-associated core domain-containing protein [Pseudomonas sp. NFX98]|uniref:RHS repeat-associated core domain-containing protein n=1 Tax=Pseudomonas sp. NFX98 TaxID=3399122 RepID=UPI0039FD4F55